MTNELCVSKTQMEFVSSETDYTLFCGGLGSGKTFAGAVWAVKMALDNKDCNGLITANSYSQLNKATLPKFFEILDLFKVPWTYKSKESVIEIFDTKIYAYSMENYNVIRGIEVGWAWSDECAFYKKEAFDVMMGRIRDNRGPCQWKGTTTPNGFNWLYEAFVSKPLPRSSVVYSKTKDNLLNLSDNYYEMLKSQYDSKLAEQELDGQFVNLTSGKVFYAFDRREHVRKVEVDISETVYVGLDFNVHPLCAIFCVKRDKKIYIFDELYLENSNTFEAAKEIVRRYPDRDLKIIPDETGNRRKTSQYKGMTDHEILRRAGLFLVKFSNPLVKDKHNNMNRLFDKNRIAIDPRCTYLIKDLEQLVHENKDEMLSHSSDTLGYAAWHLMPLKKPKRQTKVSYR